MKKILLIISAAVLPVLAQNVNNDLPSFPLAHTYSIVARDSQTGEMGVAVQSHWFSVGTLVSWAEAGVGAIATQSFVNVSFGIRGLEMLRSGLTAYQVLDSLINSDDGRDYRQLAVVDANGNVAAYTGKKCIPDAGHIVGKNYSVQANLMLNENVWPAMSLAFENSSGPLAERLVTALEAAELAGGDIRGKQSAALLVVRAVSTGKVWEDRLIDIRVDDNPEPLKELRRTLQIHRAYEHMNRGDLAVENNDMDLAMREYKAAEEMFPDNEEMKYWHAITLANNNQIDQALEIFKEVFNKNENWRELTKRLPSVGLIEVSEEELKEILELK